MLSTGKPRKNDICSFISKDMVAGNNLFLGLTICTATDLALILSTPRLVLSTKLGIGCDEACYVMAYQEDYCTCYCEVQSDRTYRGDYKDAMCGVLVKSVDDFCSLWKRRLTINVQVLYPI